MTKYEGPLVEQCPLTLNVLKRKPSPYTIFIPYVYTTIILSLQLILIAMYIRSY